ncbi:MAG: hypothetical protein IJ223_00105 [Clostridia bacterium]|nr:hypothetical protein [Clostridia bacterium]
MKLGIEREKIGDILVAEDGVDIVVCTDIVNSLFSLLPTLTRFSKSKFNIITLSNMRIPKTNTEKMEIIIPSLRIDSIVSELVHSSRAKALELINSERVFVNFEIITKSSKFINYGDIITIRGKGRFKIESLISSTKSGNIKIEVSKYI